MKNPMTSLSNMFFGSTESRYQDLIEVLELNKVLKQHLYEREDKRAQDYSKVLASTPKDSEAMRYMFEMTPEMLRERSYNQFLRKYNDKEINSALINSAKTHFNKKEIFNILKLFQKGKEQALSNFFNSKEGFKIQNTIKKMIGDVVEQFFEQSRQDFKDGKTYKASGIIELED